MEENFILGKSPLNIDGPEKLSGRAKYAIDMVLPGMVHGKVLRSPHAHAEIVNIDSSQAEALPGVCAVVTGDDLPVLEDLPGDRPTLAQGRVRYVGDAVAAVAAETLDIAEQALSLIEVTYKELPAVFDPEESIKEDTVSIHASSKGPDGEEMPPNVCHYYKVRNGNMEKGFEEADFIVENRFTTGMAQTCPMEPHAALAQVDIYGNVVAWSNTQTAYSVKTKLARLLEVPSHKVRVVVPPHIGGGFGSKTRIKSEGIAAVLSKACLKPVKVVCTREEVFSDTTVKHPFVIYIKDGVKKDGTLVAREIKEILDAGAYTEGTVGAYVTRNSAYGAVGVYSIPNFKLDNYRIYTNKPVGGAFRGFGVAQTTWAVESQMDILAEVLKMEPIEFRLKNMLKDGDLNPEGYKMHAVGSRQSLLKAAEDIEWDTAAPKNGTNGNGNGSVVRGKGIAVGCKHFSIQSSSAALRIAEDESLEIRSSVTDIGQGSRTIMAQIAAEEFNIPLEKVRLVTVDTDVTPYDTGQSGSSTTFKAGHAVRLACKDAKRKLFERASEALEARADDLETKGGKIYVKGSPEKEIRIGELFKRIPINGPGFDHGPFLEEGADIIGDATFYPANETNPQGEALPMVGFSYCSQACEVEIDTATGRIKILKFVSILDPGKPLNTELVKGQIEGGVGTGIGTALMEEMQFSSDGRLTNGNLTDYRIPTSLDFPEGDNIILDIVETDYQNGPYGAKGIGEVVLCATAATIASAIYNATGVRIKDMPLTPERVAQALAEHASNGH